MEQDEKFNIFIPSFIAVIQLIIFSQYLFKKSASNISPDIGFIYMCFLILYTIVPAINIEIGLSSEDPISHLNPTNDDLALQLWRHVIFIGGFMGGYLVLRGNKNLYVDRFNINIRSSGKIITWLTVILLLCMLYLVEMSGPVTNYYESYTRYENLPWVLFKIASVCIRFKFAIYISLITLLFINYNKYKLFILVFIFFISSFELIFNYGARIQVLLIIIQSLCLYTILVNPIKLKYIIGLFVLLISLFAFIEVVRLYESGFDDINGNLDFKSLQFPWELSSVFYPGLHLYMDRSAGMLPPVEWQMFFNDFISVFTFNDFQRWNPREWFHLNYYPTALVAPFTLGPIAESAVWGGEFDLFIRGLINGLFFAIIARWYIKHKTSWWAISIYTFFCSMAIITLKYSIFYALTPLIKSLIPIVIIVLVLQKILIYKNHEAIQ